MGGGLLGLFRMSLESQSLVLEDHVECGVVMGAQERSVILDLARRIEAAGFDSIWMGNHANTSNTFFAPDISTINNY